MSHDELRRACESIFLLAGHLPADAAAGESQVSVEIDGYRLLRDTRRFFSLRLQRGSTQAYTAYRVYARKGDIELLIWMSYDATSGSEKKAQFVQQGPWENSLLKRLLAAADRMRQRNAEVRDTLARELG